MTLNFLKLPAFGDILNAMKFLNGCIILLLLILPGIAASEKIDRLVLEDGSYELITEYRIVGDRVRYFSSERNGWEELPYSMIDWEATNKFAAQSSQQASERKEQALSRASAERAEEEARAPQVTQEIKLPSTGGVYLLDSHQEKPVLNRLRQNGADLKKNTGRNILRGVINPIAGPRQTVELKGLHAQIQSHVPTPVIFFSVDPEDPEAGYDSRTAADHLRIVRCKEKNGSRVVLALDIAIYGKVKKRMDYIEATVEPVSDYWVKITPKKALELGEYALVEFDEKGAANQFVWDFGVDPAAPANPPAVRPEVEKDAPALIHKPKKNQ